MGSIANPAVAIIGAGPFGVSVAAYLRSFGVNFRIFGTPMHRWKARMPKGMFLKSEAFASNLADPTGSYTLQQFCAEEALPYPHGSSPVPIETFSQYAISFQKRLVPMVEDVLVTTLDKRTGVFELRLATGEEVEASKVVVATGMSYTAYVPPELGELPTELMSHSSGHYDFGPFRGRDVIVIGGGQSALETAALLHENEASVRVLVRDPSVEWNPTPVPRSLWQQMLHPRSPLGNGRQSWFYSNKPQLFYRLSERTRLDLVRRTFGPAGAWWLRDRVMGRLPVLNGHLVRGAEVRGGRVVLRVHGPDGNVHDLTADHVIAATGYRFAVAALPFLSKEILHHLRCVDQVPLLSTRFESSIPGLYFTGLASANQFGPVMRFLYGAHFTARRVAYHIADH